MTILVTGATGTVGRNVVEQLLKRGADVRALVRDPSKADLPAGVAIVKGDLLDVDALRAAFSGVSTLFLLNAVVPDEFTQALIALNLAREAGIERLVYLSVIHSDVYVNVPHFAGKFGVERMLEQMGFNATILRPAYFMNNDHSIKDVVLPEYKYFKRDMILKALSEINSVTDIDVELIETKKGRRVEDIQFRVQLKAQASLLETGAAIVIDSSVIERMLRLGISEADAKEYYSNYEEKTLLATIDFVEKRIRKGPNVDAPAGYFRTALQKGFATTTPVAQALDKPKAASRPRKGYRERFIAARNQEALRYYGELSGQEQTGLYEEFSAQVDRSIRPHLKKGLNSPVVSASFAGWLSTKTWGDVTDAAVLDFAELDG